MGMIHEFWGIPVCSKPKCLYAGGEQAPASHYFGNPTEQMPNLKENYGVTQWKGGAMSVGSSTVFGFPGPAA